MYRTFWSIDLLWMNMKESQKIQLNIYGPKHPDMSRYVFFATLSSLTVFKRGKCEVNSNIFHVPQVWSIEMNLGMLFL